MGEAAKITRPLLRYHGGKWRLAPWIIGHFPEHRVYVEPFGGAASVLLRKMRSYAEVYNDLDGRLVSLFRVLRSPDAARLIESLRLTPFARLDFEESYEPTDDPVELARRTVVRSFMGFGSNSHSRSTGFRSNSNRSNTTPAHDWANYPPALAAIVERLTGVVVEHRDAIKVIETHDGHDTLFYVDPPYPSVTRGPDIDYAHEMDDDGHRRLAATLRGVRGMVVLSGYPCDLYDRELYADWHRVEKSALADGARKRTEVMWLNAAAADAIGGSGLFPAATPKGGE
jgi:DNA adenine methylase